MWASLNIVLKFPCIGFGQRGVEGTIIPKGSPLHHEQQLCTKACNELLHAVMHKEQVHLCSVTQRNEVSSFMYSYTKERNKFLCVGIHIKCNEFRRVGLLKTMLNTNLEMWVC